MKKAVIIYGWDAKPEHGWYLWLNNEFKKRGFKSNLPEMPNAEEPEMNAWTSKLKEIAGNVDDETVLVGHSIGCQTVLRYLEKLPPQKKIAKAILVAPWMKLDEQTLKEEGEGVYEIAKPWMETPIDWKKVKKHCKEIICVFSNNDPYVSLDNKDIFEKELKAKIIILKNKGHFTEDDGIKQLPEILEFLE